MPYPTIDDLPAQVRETLTPGEQSQWLAVFNAVHAQTGDEEKALLAAWGAVRKGRRVAGRAMVLGETADGLVVVKGWGLRFSTIDDPDFYGTYWQTTSELLAEYYQDAPLWYEHGFDAAYGYTPIGKRHAVALYPFGVWAEHVLFTDHPLYARTRREIEAGELAYSSDSIAHYYEQGLNMASGEVRMWPLAGWSLTRHPAEPGLGPVTLDGLDAVIREVVQVPAWRTVTEDARAVVTLTTCTSVFTPQCDPTVPAVLLTDDPEAREAQRAADGHLSSDTSPSEGPIMTPEALRALADFFGVDATPEAVRAEMDTLIASLRDDDAEIDVAALRAALDLDDDDGEDVVITELAAMRALLDEGEDGEDEGDTPTRSTYNHHALRTARSLMRAGNDDMPHHVPQGAHTAGRSRSLGGARFNTGTRAPSVEDAVMAALGIKPPGFRRGTLNDARARLFQMDRAARAADSGTGVTGAFVLNTEISDTIMQPLVNKLVLFQAGAYRWPMVGVDSVTIRKQVGLPGAYWAAENSEATQQQDIQWAVATLNLKELRAPTTWPNRWLRNVLPSVEGMIRDSIERSMRLELESSALYGIGGRPAGAGNTGAQPLGVRYTDGVAVTDMAGAALDVDDLATAIGTLEDNNVEETDTWGWISRPSLFRGFEFMKDLNGHPIMRNSWMDGVRSQNLVDYPYHKTNQVPLVNQQTDLFFGDWQELVIGIGQDVELVVSEHRYVEQNSTFVMGVAYVDTAVMWSEAFHIHTGCG